jgi:PAS domain-containing protein
MIALVPSGLATLDVAELDGRGARAILQPNESIFSALFTGVNRDICNLFGYDIHEFQSQPFTWLNGPTTDTKRLQAMWTDVLQGSDESFEFDFYNKSGTVVSVNVDFLPRVFDHRRTSGVDIVFARINETSKSCSPDIPNQHQLFRIRNSTSKPLRLRSSLIYDETLAAENDLPESIRLRKPRVKKTSKIS